MIPGQSFPYFSRVNSKIFKFSFFKKTCQQSFCLFAFPQCFKQLHFQLNCLHRLVLFNTHSWFPLALSLIFSSCTIPVLGMMLLTKHQHTCLWDIMTHLGYKCLQNSPWTWRGLPEFISCDKWNADTFPLTMHSKNCKALLALT